MNRPPDVSGWRRRVAATVVALGAIVPVAWAGTYRIRSGESDLTVVTHRAGFASALAHDHVVEAHGYDATLRFDSARPLDGRFELVVPVERLAVDAPGVRRRVLPRLEELSVAEFGDGTLSDRDRARVREAMLAAGQLDAGAFPVIAVRASVTDVGDDDPFPVDVELSFEIRGREVRRNARAGYRIEQGVLHIEAHGSFRFTDFGIEPYSAFFGAVRNRDRFDVYLRLVADPVDDADDAEERP